MDIELINYKNQKIKEAINNYNYNISLLNIRFNNSLRLIYRLRNINRVQLINTLIKDYNNKVNTLKNNLNNTINSINNLTNIPGRIITNQNRTEPSKFALIIGINYNNTPNQLYGCINDANNIQNLLISQYNYENKNIILLTDNTDNKPTKNNIINNLTYLLKNSISGDKIFLFYSGHGSNFFDTNNDELDGQDEALVPIDATSKNTTILDDELNILIKNNIKENVSLYALFDCCHSGTILDLKYNYFDGNDNNETINNNLIQETNGKVIMISGCKDNQTSMDSFFINQNSGALTFSFLDSLKKFDKNNVLIKDLLLSMRSFLKNNNFEQIPVLASNRFININDEKLIL